MSLNTDKIIIFPSSYLVLKVFGERQHQAAFFRLFYARRVGEINLRHSYPSCMLAATVFFFPWRNNSSGCTSVVYRLDIFV